jgi:hypothetical protein
LRRNPVIAPAQTENPPARGNVAVINETPTNVMKSKEPDNAVRTECRQESALTTPSRSETRESLQGRLFHCTSLKNLKAILRAGAIQSNQGQFPFNHPLSSISVVRRLGGISLWDLSSPRGLSWFMSWLPLTRLAVEVDRGRVEPHLFEPVGKGFGMRLPGEMGCGVPIPTSWFRGYLAIGPKVAGRRGRLEFFELGTNPRVIAATIRRDSTSSRNKANL